jgi:hypothetical protein
MIFLRLSGGLGNQLYQLAAAALLAQDLNRPVMPFIDALQRYDVPRDPDSFKLLQWNEWLREPSVEHHRIGRWLSVCARAGRFTPLIGISDRNFLTSTRSLSGFPRFLDGYFQHGWTQDSFSKAISAMKMRPEATSSAHRLGTDEVAVHIRGGDFLKLPRFQVVHAPFYVEAAESATVAGFRRFGVVTDDPEYAITVCRSIEEKLPSFNFRILDRAESSLDDFDVLRTASARIIGNSTFAWWAAALGPTSSPTWSPPMFTTDDPRDFFLPNERMVGTRTA